MENEKELLDMYTAAALTGMIAATNATFTQAKIRAMVLKARAIGYEAVHYIPGESK